MADQRLSAWMEAMDAGTQKALGEVLKRVVDIPPPQVIPYLCALATLSINLLRADGNADDFVKDFLTAAQASLKEPAPLALKDLRVN